MKDIFASSTALGLVQEYSAKVKAQVRSAAQAAHHPKLAPASSVDMMCSLLEEIFLVNCGILVKARHKQKGDGAISVKIAPINSADTADNKYNHLSPGVAERVIAMTLSRLADKAYADDVTIKPHKGKIDTNTKSGLFNFLNRMIDQRIEDHEKDKTLKTFYTPSHNSFPDIEPHEYKEFTQYYSTLAMVASTHFEKASANFQSVVTKPYVDMNHYLSYLYLGSRANLSISITHIYRCLQQEEHRQPGKYDNALIFGGNN